MTFSRRRNGRSRSRRQGPPSRAASLSRRRAETFPPARGLASPTAGRRASPAVGRRTSAAVGQRTSLVVGRRVAPTFGRRTFLADGPRMLSAAARQASPAAGWVFSGRRAADVSLPDGKFPRCRAAHFLCCWAANFSYCRAANSSCRREASFSRRCARAALLSSSFGAALYRSTGLRVAVQALDKRSVSVDRMAGLSEKGFLPPFGGRPSHTAAA